MHKKVFSKGLVCIEYEEQKLAYKNAIQPVIEKLNTQRGALFDSNYEYPGRYTCWDIGFYNPPLAITIRHESIVLQALNERGEVLLRIMAPLLKETENLRLTKEESKLFEVEIIKSKTLFSEEERSKQPSLFSLLRVLLDFFKCDEPYLGFYGAFGYDLIFQFENLKKVLERDDLQRDMVLYLPDEIYVVDHRKEVAFVRRYDFSLANERTHHLKREGESSNYDALYEPKKEADHEVGEYANLVNVAKARFKVGDLFEVVPSQTFYTAFKDKPSSLFKMMRQLNPSPYGFFINLGEKEYLVGASPEMYVRLRGKEVETCPISGTIKRGENAIEDAENIQLLLSSEKEASELTMCTDVDRNDKSRICEPGSVKVLGRRQIEMYSRLIHTVDHVKGTLREDFDAIDAFLTHMWVVTVTGAPKIWAMNFIEAHEKSPRKWYAGAVGWFGFNGDLNTGLVLRTVRLKEGIAEIRVGATLLYDSIPEDEEAETRLKASAFLEMLRKFNQPKKEPVQKESKPGLGKKVLLVDHQDSFVHTLANYLRQTGAEVTTVRHELVKQYLDETDFDLVFLSPGPGSPKDFKLNETIALAIKKKIPIFGVCLGLQGLVEYFGGDLDVLSYPMHGKASLIKVKLDTPLFSGLGDSFTAGRYHSLHARRSTFPVELKITAQSEDGVVMAISHQTLPIHAVQFHPETILSLSKNAGLRIISNLMDMLN